jgi:hypothetical protein
MTQTPTMTSSPSSTPNFLYVYESCTLIGGGRGSITQVIQTQPLSFTITVNEVFKDTEGNCWFFVGIFNSSYIAPPRLNPINYGGNYFIGSPSETYTDCVTCAFSSINQLNNSGISNLSVEDACSDSSFNSKTLYTTCDTLSAGCSLYYNSNLTTLVSELFVLANGVSWDMNGLGVIIGLSSTQC